MDDEMFPRMSGGVPPMQHIRENMKKMNQSNPEFEAAFENNDFSRLQELWRSNRDLLRLKMSYNINHMMTVHENETQVKSDEKSNSIRLHGNQLLRHARSSEPHTYLPVLYQYEMALCFAESAECKYKAFGNISKMYEHLKMPDQCYKATEYAIKLGDSASNQFKQKMKGRLLHCYRHVEVNIEVRAKVTNHEPPTSFISKDFKLCQDSGERYVVSTKALQPGDIVAAIKPFTTISKPTFRRQTCTYCGKRSALNRLPCEHCVHVTFCDENCKELGMSKGIHTIECDLFLNGFLLQESDMHFALKFALDALAGTKGDLQVNDPSFTCFDWKDNDLDDTKNTVKAILNMKTIKLGLPKMVEVTLGFNLLLDTLRRMEVFNELVSRFKGGEKLFTETFFKAYRILKFNGIHTDYKLTIDGFYGNLTHSCKPNLVVLQHPRFATNVYVVLQEIKVGEQLTVAFG